MSKLGSSVAEWVWASPAVGARVARLALSPASALFGAIVTSRNARFDRALRDTTGDARGVRRSVLPALSVGNLTVGGTGKTPVAAWCARQLKNAGAKPAIVLRGYGDDEWRVHTLINPGVPVVVAPDRLNGIATARTNGATCVVLDDAFQHRQASRVSDIVLVSADRWTGLATLLPAGPYREPLSALRRANAVVITAKAANAAQIDALETAILNAAPQSAVAVVRLVLGKLNLAAVLPATSGAAPKITPRSGDADSLLARSTDWLRGRRIVAVSAVGDPLAFRLQLEQLGAIVDSVRFGDHHAFSMQDAAGIARKAAGTDGVVCTLKDAVKLGPLWPRVAPPLWYVSQSVVVERGAPALERALARVLAARTATTLTAG